MMIKKLLPLALSVCAVLVPGSSTAYGATFIVTGIDNLAPALAGLNPNIGWQDSAAVTGVPEATVEIRERAQQIVTAGLGGPVASAAEAGPDSDDDGSPDSSDLDDDNDSSLPPEYTECKGPCPGGFSRDAIEAFVGTSPTDGCADTLALNDEADDKWPPDFNDDRQVSALDFSLWKNHFPSSSDDPKYSSRSDLNGSGAVNVADFPMWKIYFNLTCTPAPQTCLGQVATIAGTAGVDLITGTAEGDVIVGMAGDDTINGLGGDDWICGGGGGDNMLGGDGSDIIFGRDGDDSLQAEAGEGDILLGGSGDDSLDGGEGGFDFVFYFAASGPVQVNLATGLASGGDGSDALSGVEALFGSVWDDTLIGNGDLNVLFGGPGNDSLDGADGFDINGYLLGSVQADLGTGQASGAEGTDTFVGMEGLVGSDAGSSLTGDAGPNILIGGSQIDVLTGGSGDDAMFGQGGVDQLNGGDGNDILGGGDGADILNGGPGANDVATYFDSASVVQGDLATGTVVTYETSDTLVAIEGLEGSEFNDVLTGDGLANFLFGGAGNDMLFGVNGADSLYGSAGDDNLAGGDQDDFLDGGDGTDGLDGGPGVDACYIGENVVNCEVPAPGAQAATAGTAALVAEPGSVADLILQLSPLPECGQGAGGYGPQPLNITAWTPAGVPYLENSPGVVDVQTVWLKMHFYRWEGGSKRYLASAPPAPLDWFVTEVNEQTKPVSSQDWFYLKGGSWFYDAWYWPFDIGQDYTNSYSIEFELWWWQIDQQALYGPLTVYLPHHNLDNTYKDYCFSYRIEYWTLGVSLATLFRPVGPVGIVY